MQRFETDVRFICPNCGKAARTTVEVPEPNWEASDKLSELTSDDQTEVICNKCGTEFSAYVFNSPSGCEITLDDYPNTHIHADLAFFSPDDGDWVSDVVPVDPHNVFMDSYHQTGDILANHGGQDGSHLINRMVFAQQVSALEAYLGDTLLKHTRENPEAINRLLAVDKELNAEKFTLADINTNPALVEEKVTAYLRSILYHNLAKVDFLYRSALGVRVLRDKTDNAKLHEAIKYRHDCVHRNGRGQDGNQLKLFTKAYVKEITDLIRALVDQIEHDVRLSCAKDMIES